MEENTYSNDFIEMRIQNGIILAEYKPYITITLEVAKECVEARVKLTKGNTYPLFADVRKVQTWTKDARKYLAGPDGIKGMAAGAIQIKTQIEVLLVNTWLSIDSPPIPTRLFTDREKAIHWLEQFKRFN